MKPYNLHWHGMLTTENAKEVGKLMTELLTGKFFTFVAAHPAILPKLDEQHPETVDMRMDVRPSQRLFADPGKKPINVSITDGKYAHLTIYDTYGLAILDTNLTGKYGQFDHTYQNPYFSFDGNRVTIWHRAPAGNLTFAPDPLRVKVGLPLLVWSYAVENHEE